MKLNYIEWYLVELRRRLLDTMPLDQESSFILETKYHLESLAEEFRVNGMDPRAAEIAAIERFGTPDMIASECLLGIRRSKEKKLIFCTGIVLALIIIAITSGVSSGPTNWMPFAYSSSYSYLPIGFGIAIYALILGKMPSWKWFAFPALCMALFGVIAGVQNTFYNIPGSMSVARNYGDLHNQYVQINAQHKLASELEHETANSWRSVIASAKDMKPSDVLEIPELRYIEQKSGTPDYTEEFATSSGFVRSYGYSNSGTIVSRTTGNASFRYLPNQEKLVLKGPLTAHDVRSTAIGKLNNVQNRGKMRDAIVENMRNGLNIPIASRVSSIVNARVRIYLFEIGPIAIIFSFFFSKIRNRIRFREKNMRMA